MGSENRTAGKPASRVLAMSGLASFVVLLAVTLGSLGLLAPGKAEAAAKYDYQATVHGCLTSDHKTKVTAVFTYYNVTSDTANSRAEADFAAKYPYPTYEMTSATIIRIK